MISPTPFAQLVAALALLASTSSAFPLPASSLSSRAGPISSDGARVVLGRLRRSLAAQPEHAAVAGTQAKRAAADATRPRHDRALHQESRIAAAKAMQERGRKQRDRRAGISALAPDASVLASAAVADDPAGTVASTTSAQVTVTVTSHVEVLTATLTTFDSTRQHILPTALPHNATHWTHHHNSTANHPPARHTRVLPPVALPTLTLTEVVTLVPINGQYVDEAKIHTASGSGYRLNPSPSGSIALGPGPASVPASFFPSGSAVATTVVRQTTVPAVSAIPTGAHHSLPGLSRIPLAQPVGNGL